MSDSDEQPILTRSLMAFLLFVVAALSIGLFTRESASDLPSAIALLSDGDLDQAERQRMLLRVLELSKETDPLHERWASLLAAVALEESEEFAILEARLGSGPARILAPEFHEESALGDPVLRNVLSAMLAEASEEKDVAVVRWGQVVAQARMTGNQFAKGLASTALQRLR
jgi:hypothetical protein